MSELPFNLTKLAADLGEHSIFSPSGSAMWLYCSGSLIPNLLAGDRSSPEAAEGTVAHGVAEIWLKTGRKPRHLIGTIETVVEKDATYHIEITHAMLDHVERYVTWCWQQDGDHFVETKVFFSDLTPIEKQGGTADHCACKPGRLVITDLKYGKGIMVYATNNTQLLLYAYGFFMQYDWFYDFQEIEMRIAQPRLGHFDTWVISRAELLEFAEWVKIRALLAWQVNASRTPGEKQCQWCKVRQDCVAAAMLQDSLIDMVFGDLEVTPETMADFKDRVTDEWDLYKMKLPDMNTLTLEQKATLIQYRKMCEKWWASLADDLDTLAGQGVQIPYHKLVNGKSFREYTNEDQAVEELRFIGLPDDVIFKQSMITPAQAEDAIRKVGYKGKEIPDLMRGFVQKPLGKPVLVSHHDPRPAISETVDKVFGNLDDDGL